MKKNVSLTVSHVSKSFAQSRPDSIKKIVNFFSHAHDQKKVLNDISFSVKQGEAIGLYGPNGAGKSTLLRVMAGIIKPDQGSVITNGRLTTVIELGSGLHPELTGIENIHLYGSLSGISKSYLQKILPKIVAFSGLEKYIDAPIKKYSSGMKARLAFSSILFSAADIYLLDEVFAVGDTEFVDKSFIKLKELKPKSIFVVASHNMSLLDGFCDRVVTLDNGSLVDNAAAIELVATMPIGHTFTTTIQTHSMYPLLKKGDVVRVKKVPFAKLKNGDLVAINLPKFGIIVVHRLIAKANQGNRSFLLSKGDNSIMTDPWQITPDTYLGKVTAISHS